MPISNATGADYALDRSPVFHSHLETNDAQNYSHSHSHHIELVKLVHFIESGYESLRSASLELVIMHLLQLPKKTKQNKKLVVGLQYSDIFTILHTS